MLTIYLIGLVITFLFCVWAESESINFLSDPMDGAVLVIFTSVIWPIAVLIVSVETLIGYIKRKRGR